MTAVIYARYSSDNQREESIEGQIRECTAYAEKNGITVVKHYIDRALSAKTDNRPGCQPLASRALTSRHRLPTALPRKEAVYGRYLTCIRLLHICVAQRPRILQSVPSESSLFDITPGNASHCGISRRGRLSSRHRSASARHRFRKGRSCRFPKHMRDPKWRATCLRSAPQAEWSFRLR